MLYLNWGEVAGVAWYVQSLPDLHSQRPSYRNEALRERL